MAGNGTSIVRRLTGSAANDPLDWLGSSGGLLPRRGSPRRHRLSPSNQRKWAVFILKLT
jgi:hypothetical protein